MITDPLFYVVAIPAMLVLGISKGGMGAVNILVVPIMAIVISPIQAAAIVLPILIASDIVAVASYRGTFDRHTLAVFLPGAAVGILVGWATAAWTSDDAVRLILGVVSLAFASAYFLRGGHRREAVERNAVRGVVWGAVGGFTSFVSHAGGPPFQAYVGPLKFEPKVFAGTMIIAFAAINAAKLLPFFLLGQFDGTNLMTSAVLLPISVPATFLGIWVVRRIHAETFYPIIYALMMVVGTYLAGDAITSFLAG